MLEGDIYHGKEKTVESGEVFSGVLAEVEGVKCCNFR